ncbi:MAG TPA: type II toxin-antitoxin system RelE/ParE family toxin [Thermomicrobiales bacterium]|nr:type II toxin-antitoxin system RelE/ParE family toxin [Thermomicrobiales bacterium]
MHHKRVEASFYRSDSGDEPVRDWLKSLPADDRRAIGFDLKTIEFCFSQNRIVLLHGFIKKTQKTPQSDLAIARSRKKETMSHE